MITLIAREAGRADGIYPLKISMLYDGDSSLSFTYTDSANLSTSCKFAKVMSLAQQD